LTIFRNFCKIGIVIREFFLEAETRANHFADTTGKITEMIHKHENRLNRARLERTLERTGAEHRKTPKR
jgi:hypothetical protein